MVEVFIALILERMSFVAEFELRRRDIVASSPDLHLFFSVLFNSFKFVEALKSSVMSFIESPVLDHWDVVAINFVRSIVEGLNGASKDRGIADIKLVSVLSEGFSCVDGFLDS